MLPLTLFTFHLNHKHFLPFYLKCVFGGIFFPKPLFDSLENIQPLTGLTSLVFIHTSHFKHSCNLLQRKKIKVDGTQHDID